MFSSHVLCHSAVACTCTRMSMILDRTRRVQLQGHVDNCNKEQPHAMASTSCLAGGLQDRIAATLSAASARAIGSMPPRVGATDAELCMCAQQFLSSRTCAAVLPLAGRARPPPLPLHQCTHGRQPCLSLSPCARA